jgi:hypothetical protein
VGRLSVRWIGWQGFSTKSSCAGWVAVVVRSCHGNKRNTSIHRTLLGEVSDVGFDIRRLAGDDRDLDANDPLRRALVLVEELEGILAGLAGLAGVES